MKRKHRRLIMVSALVVCLGAATILGEPGAACGEAVAKR